MRESLVNVQRAIADLEYESIQGIVRGCLDEGVPGWEIIRDGIGGGMKQVGERFQAGDYFLADLIMSGEMVKEAMAVLGDTVDTAKTRNKGKVILATVKGDMHDIGKNIVGMMLSAAGFEIIDLGADVHEDRIVKAVRESGARAIGLSVLLTTMISSIRDVVDALRKAGLRDEVKIAIGGACTYEKLAKEMGVDLYGADAVQAVRLFEDFVSV